MFATSLAVMNVKDIEHTKIDLGVAMSTLAIAALAIENRTVQSTIGTAASIITTEIKHVLVSLFPFNLECSCLAHFG